MWEENPTVPREPASAYSGSAESAKTGEKCADQPCRGFFYWNKKAAPIGAARKSRY
jgi:hypothetical protein